MEAQETFEVEMSNTVSKKQLLEIYFPMEASAHSIIKSGFRDYFYVISENGELEESDVLYLHKDDVIGHFKEIEQVEPFMSQIEEFVQ